MSSAYFRKAAVHFHVQEVLAWGGFTVAFSSLAYIFFVHGRASSAPPAPTRLSLRALLELEESAKTDKSRA